MLIVRKTNSLKLILNEFKNESTTISSIKIIKRLNSKLNKTTVYRTLENFEKDGFLHSFLGKDAFKRYAIRSNCSKLIHEDIHPHFGCINCGKIDCLKIEVKIPEIRYREVTSSQILLQGK